MYNGINESKFQFGQPGELPAFPQNDWNYTSLGFSGNLRWRYIGERLFIDFQGNQTMAPWYATWHLRLHQEVWDPVSVFFEVNNILDYQNRNYVALPGRLFFVGIEIN